jgi:peroxiredoxin
MRMNSVERILKAAVFGFAVLSFASMPYASQAAPNINKKAPEFTGTDSNGKTHRLGDYKGSIVVLEWFNHECPFVEKHYATKNMQKLQKHARKNGIVWLSVVSSAPGEQGFAKPAEARDISKKVGANHSAKILDSSGVIGRKYGAQTTPHMYVIDKKGDLVYMGGIDNKPSTQHEDVKTAKNHVKAALDDVLSGKTVRNPVTEPYGCSVKYAN